MFFNIYGLAQYHTFFYVVSLNKCVVDVFVYTLRQKDFKEKLRQVGRKLCCRKPKKKPNITLFTMVGQQMRKPSTWNTTASK
ncbi:hypothetical protein L596_020553 [Steinernema carpocapsae]|uniref:Uncharacterized protein n=1 Tax=Steinernema carpocapsae TaxID=34508 RepID=A0A4U5MTV9_STECR|nr:hypothetical protein L596_020553 [Steinernema carpocapsae]